MSLSKLVYETSSEPMTSPPRSSTIPRYSDEACLCVTDLRRDTTLSKGTLNFTKNACRFFPPHYVHVIFLFYPCVIVCQLRSDLCPKKTQGIATNDLTLISNDAFFHTHTHTHRYARGSQDRTVDLKAKVSAKYTSVIRARRSRDDSLTAIHYTYVLLSRTRPIITTFRMAGKLSNECRVR